MQIELTIYCDYYFFQQVNKEFKLYVIYVLDSIVKTVDGNVYRNLFGQHLPNVILHVFATATLEVQDQLCVMRQTWSKLFAINVLNELDANVRKQDSLWPYTKFQRKLMAKVREVDSQIERMRMEIGALEQQLEKDVQAKVAAVEERKCKRKVSFDSDK